MTNPGESSPSRVNPTFGHRVEYAAAMLLGGLVRRLGPSGADRMGVTVGRIVYSLMKSRRWLAEDNLRLSMGDSLSEMEIQQTIRRVFENIGRSLVEFGRFPVMTLEDVNRLVVGEGKEQLRKAHEEGKGCMFLTSHYGNWELLGAWVRAQGYPVSLIVGTQSNPLIHQMINWFRSSLEVDVIQVQELRKVFRFLKNNGVVATAGDQHAPAEAILLDFLGRPAWVARGPALFAHRCGCPILPCLMVRERLDRHRVIAGELIYSPQSGDDEADILEMTRAHVRFFEEGIRRYPDQWMWTHKRWKVAKKSGNQSEAGT